MQAPTGSAGFASSDSRSAMPYPYWGGLTFKVDGDLPELADHAPAWKATGPVLDRTAMARIADALGVSGTPVQRDGGWWVDGGDWTLNAFPGGDMWSVNLFRGRYDGRGDDAASAAATPTGPALSRAQAESRVRDLIGRMDAPAGSWEVETAETEIGVGWGCAAPGFGDEELKRLEPEHDEALIGPAPADQPAPDIAAAPAPCPPPPAPAPVKGFQRRPLPAPRRSTGRLAGVERHPPLRRPDRKPRRLLGRLRTGREPQAAGRQRRPRGAPVAARAPAPGGRRGHRPRWARDPGRRRPGRRPPRLLHHPQRRGHHEGRIGRPRLRPDPPPPGRRHRYDRRCDAGNRAGAARLRRAVPMPMPAEKATSSYAPGCGSWEPQVVTITKVELGLIQAPVFENGRTRLHLVPAYRFTGRFDNGTAWETSVVALHPDAIAPPPDFPGPGDLRGADGVPAIGRAVPPTPPDARTEPAKPTSR